MCDLPKIHSGQRQTSPPLKYLPFLQSLKPSVQALEGQAHTGQSNQGSNQLLSLTAQPRLSLDHCTQTPRCGRTIITAVAMFCGLVR